MRIIASPKFLKFKKKATAALQSKIDDAVRVIVADPAVGIAKKGDLSGVRVHKFRVDARRYLVAYVVEEEQLLLLAWGVHENFYRNLKR